MIGRVTSIKNKNTATVILESTKTHPLYKKSFISTKKYLADDKLGVKQGDIVEFSKCRPISKNKHWKISRILGSDIVALGTEHMQKKAEEAIEEVLPEEKEEEGKEVKKKLEKEEVSK